MKNNQNLFFSPEEKGRAFSDVLKEVQEYISSKYSTLMVEGGSEEVKQQVKRYITKYICDYRITVKGKTQDRNHQDNRQKYDHRPQASTLFHNFPS